MYLLTGKLPFEEKTDIIQVLKIMSVLGTPNEFNWPGFQAEAQRIPCFRFKDRKGYQDDKIRQLFGTVSCTSMHDLVVKLLNLGPQNRLDAETVCNTMHVSFNEYYIT